MLSNPNQQHLQQVDELLLTMDAALLVNVTYMILERTIGASLSEAHLMRNEHRLQQVFHLAAQRMCKRRHLACTSMVDVLLSLLVLLNGAHGNTRCRSEFGLAQASPFAT